MSERTSSKTERELGWKPAETFEPGIRKTVQWYLDHRDWVQHVQDGAYRDKLSQSIRIGEHHENSASR